MSIDKTCKGCGIKLQTENSEQLGYIKDLNHDLCLDCFSLKHYQKSKRRHPSCSNARNK